MLFRFMFDCCLRQSHHVTDSSHDPVSALLFVFYSNGMLSRLLVGWLLKFLVGILGIGETLRHHQFFIFSVSDFVLKGGGV